MPVPGVDRRRIQPGLHELQFSAEPLEALQILGADVLAPADTDVRGLVPLIGDQALAGSGKPIALPL